jgi:hypothetical protein
MADNGMQMQPLLPPERAATRSGLEEITPELIEMAAEYGYISQDQKLQLLQHKQASEMRGTKMPTFHSLADGQTVAANPMEQAAAAIQQYRGGEQEQAAMQALQANNMRQQGIDKYALQQDIARRKNDFQSLQPPPPPTPEEYAATEAAIAERTKGVDLDLGLGAPSRPVRKPAPPNTGEPLPAEGNVGAPLLPRYMKRPESPFYGFRAVVPNPTVK